MSVNIKLGRRPFLSVTDQTCDRARTDVNPVRQPAYAPATTVQKKKTRRCEAVPGEWQAALTHLSAEEEFD